MLGILSYLKTETEKFIWNRKFLLDYSANSLFVHASANFLLVTFQMGLLTLGAIVEKNRAGLSTEMAILMIYITKIHIDCA